MKKPNYFLWLIFAMLQILVACASEIETSLTEQPLSVEEADALLSSRASDSLTFSYAVTPANPEWAAIESHADKIKMCAIPEEVLSALTTEQLVRVCLDYPLLIDAYAYDDFSYGIEVLCNQFNGMKELLSRVDNAEAIVSVSLQAALIQFLYPGPMMV